MNDYTFEMLNDKDFEVLLRDLLQCELQLSLESFKTGKDDGIDLRHSSASDPDENLVVQAKHWRKSGYKALLRHLKLTELNKVQRMAPSRYILCTSVPLSPKNKREIQVLLSPFIVSSGDIYGLDDVNNLIGKFPQVEKKHFKLWINSTTVLERILHNAVASRSEFVKEEILKKASLFVPTDSYARAIDILNNAHVLLIKGVPGVGKTTLAQFLIYRLLDRDYELVVIEESLRDGEELFRAGARQVFYFDDFLGSNYLELIHARGSGANISRFVDRVLRDKQKRLVLTTRTTILNKALAQMHQLGGPKLGRSDFELHIEDYSRIDKARILYNHMYFCGLPTDYSEHIFADENYLWIIDHKNYNPRVIEFITDPFRLESVQPAEYLDFVKHNLEHPEDIWASAYDNQIDFNGRFIVDSLFSLGDDIASADLQEAFDARMNHEIASGGYQRQGNAFQNGIRDLLDGFLVHERSPGEDGRFSFVNPSIVDFLINRYSQSPGEKWRIIESSVYIEQLQTRFGTEENSAIRILATEKQRFLDAILTRLTSLKTSNGVNPELGICLLLLRMFDWEDVADVCEAIVARIEIVGAPYAEHRMIAGIIYRWSPKSRSVLTKRLTEFARFLFETATDEDDFSHVVRLFARQGYDYNKWLSEGDNRQFVQHCVDSYWDGAIGEYIDNDYRIDGLFEVDEIEEVLDEILSDASDLNTSLNLEISPALDDSSIVDPEEILERNNLAASKADYESELGKDFRRSGDRSDIAQIRDLFEK